MIIQINKEALKIYKNKYSFLFCLQMFSLEYDMLVYRGEDINTEQHLYLVFRGCKKLSNKMNQLFLHELTLNTNRGLIEVKHNNNPSGLACKSIELWDDEQYDLFELNLIDENSHSQPIVAAVLDKTII